MSSKMTSVADTATIIMTTNKNNHEHNE